MRKAALITGSAKRIGKEIARALSSLGYDIALHYRRSKDEAKRLALEIKGRGGACEIFKCDFSDEKETLRLIQTVKKQFPGLSLLVNSASIFKKSRLVPIDVNTFDNHFAVNFKAPFILSCEFARICKKGHIVNLLDTNIVRNKTAYPAYLLSKKALADFTKLAASEFAPDIRVNGIAPGLILPPMGKTDDYLTHLAKGIPLQKKGNTHQIAQTVRALEENEYITGQIIFVDGGAHLLSENKD